MDNQKIQEKLKIIVSNESGLMEALLFLDNLIATDAKSLDKRLVHYLEKRSYEKALKFLNGEKVSG